MAAGLTQNTLSEFGYPSQIVNQALFSVVLLAVFLFILFLRVICLFDLLQVVFSLIPFGQYGVQSLRVRG